MNGKLTILALGAVLVLGISGCKSNDSDSETTLETRTTTSDTLSTPKLSLSVPESLTGGTATSNQAHKQDPRFAATDSGPDCNFAGQEQTDPFQNGRSMTQWLTGMASAQLCLADFLVEVGKSAAIPADGKPWPLLSPDPEAPTYLSLEKNSSSQYTMKLYWGEDTTSADQYISWNTSGGVTRGKMVMFADAMGGTNSDAPDRVRVDFSQSSAENKVDVYIAFPDANTFMNGFRIELTEDPTLTAATANRFTVRAIMALKDQFMADWDTSYRQYITEVPALKIYTIANADGDGAASALVSNQGMGMGTLGYYLFDKTDQYFFAATGNSQYIHKAITSATYKGAKTSTTTVDNYLEGLLGLATGTLASCTSGSSTACTSFIGAMFAVGQGGLEGNSGSDPGDGRSTIIKGLTSASYLASPYPDGATSWNGVFDLTFTP